MQKIFTLLFSLCTINAYAQNYGGTIYDRERRPLQEATIYNHRTGTHTHTNEVDVFRLQDGQLGDTLKVSHVSFKTQVLVLQKQSQTIILEPSNLELNEVAITSSIRHLNII